MGDLRRLEDPDGVASCAGQVTASAKQRLRCRRASQHDACAEPSVPADTVEREMGGFLSVALTLPATLRPRLAALVGAKVAHGSDQASAERLRAAIKRLTDAYTWGGVGEADYREQLTSRREQFAKADRAPDERHVMEAIRVAQDVGLAWEKARPQRRHEMLDVLFESVTIGDRRLVSVKPRDDVAPLFAVKLLQSGGPDRGLSRNIEHSTGS